MFSIAAAVPPMYGALSGPSRGKLRSRLLVWMMPFIHFVSFATETKVATVPTGEFAAGMSEFDALRLPH